jgi:hypothetical protein
MSVSMKSFPKEVVVVGIRDVSPSAIGTAPVMLAEQPKSAWTFELNLKSHAGWPAGPGYDKDKLEYFINNNKHFGPIPCST